MNKITLKEFYNRATAKNIKTMRAHDGPSQEWDVYFDNKKSTEIVRKFNKLRLCCLHVQKK